MTAKPPMRM